MTVDPGFPRPGRLAFLGAGLISILLASTLGEGGAQPTAMLAWHAMTVVMLLAAVLGGAPSGWTRLAPAPLAAFVLFLAIAGIGATAAPYAFAAFLVGVELAMFLAAAVVAAWCGTGFLETAGPWLLAGGALHGLAALSQRFFADVPRPASTFLNANHLAAWLVAVLLLNMSRVSPLGRPFGIRALAALPVLAGIAVSGSRGALLGLVAGAALWIAQAWPELPGRARRIVLAGSAAGLVLVAAGVAWRFRQPDPFPFQRIAIWRASLRAAAESPWLGTGPGQFRAAAVNLNVPVDVGPLRYARSFSTPHSDLLRAPCEFGWPAAAALGLAAVFAAAAVRRNARAGVLTPSSRGGAAALAALIVQGAVDDLTSRPAVYLLGAAILGALLSTPREARSDPPPRWRALLAAILLLGFVVGDAAPYRAWRETVDLPRGRLRAEQRRRLDRALRSNPFHPDLWLRRAEDLAGNGSDWDLEIYARAREAAERACRLQPADATYVRGLARVEGFGVRTLFRDEAGRERTRALYRAAEDRARTDPFFPLEEGEFALSAGDAAGALDAADRAQAIEPLAVPPRLLRAEAILVLGGSDAPSRAGREIDEAERLAARWESWPRLSAYEARLLTVDAQRAAELRSRIAAALPHARPEGGTAGSPR